MNGSMIKRVIMTIAGVLICGISVGMFGFSDLGVDPFQVFAQGTWTLTPVSYGTYYVILNAVMLIAILLVDRRKIGLGTVINLFLLGYVVQFCSEFLHKIIPEPSLIVRSFALLAAIVIMCLATALYFTADLGVSTYDAVAIILDERKPGWKFKYIRMATDLICVIVGAIFGGTVGIGTVVTAFFMGPLIAFFKSTVAEPLLYGHALHKT